MTHYPDHDDPDPRPQRQGERDRAGRFKPGHAVGAVTRWQPGESGNPGGQAVGDEQPGRWLPALAGSTEDTLRAVVADPAASCSKRAAARLWLDALADTDPHVRRNAHRVILDRIEGKPTLAVTVAAHHTPDPAEAEARLVALIERRPDLLAEVVARSPGLVESLRARLGTGG